MSSVCEGTTERERVLELRRTAVDKMHRMLFDCCVPVSITEGVLLILEEALSRELQTSHHGILPGVPRRLQR